MRRILSVIACLGLFPASAFAGGAHQTNIDGVPYRWLDNVVYNVDRGDLKPGLAAYSQDSVSQMIAESFAAWRGTLTQGDLPVSEGAGLPLSADGGSDVNISNSSLYLNSNANVNPIVFDADGEIIEAMFGDCAQFSLLGFAGFEQLDRDNAAIIKARAVFGGSCIPDGSGHTASKSGCGPCPFVMDESQVRTMILHEIGHFLGIDHSQVNPQSYLQCEALGSCSVALEEDLPTMFPLIMAGAAMQTLHQDDVASFNRLYGNPEADFCTVTGRVLGSDGSTELRGVEVVARNTNPGLSETDAISFVSGAEAPRLSATGKGAANCAGNCGDYEITGLREGESYQLCVQNILSQFNGGSGIEPVDPPQSQVAPDCPQGLTVSCTCDGTGCAVFNGQDIVTTPFDASASAQGNLSEEFGGAAGGCSLMPAPRTRLWPRFKNLLVFALGIQ